MAPDTQELTIDQIRALLADICATLKVISVVPGPKSYSNRLWIAETDEGPLLVRVPGRTTDPEYVRVSLTAAGLAGDAGIPTVRFRTFAPTTRIGLPVVVQEFLPGESASEAMQRGRVKLSELAVRLGDWIGTLHRIRRDTFGTVNGSSGSFNWADTVRSMVESSLSNVAKETLPAKRAVIESAFERALVDLPKVASASLVHGDLYFDNLLVDQGYASALLDFEHARFYDRFADFGKLTEMVFEWWPGAEEPFMEGYCHHFPSDPSDLPRRRIGVGLYELNQLAYFSRWEPELVSVYRARLNDWLVTR